MTQPGCYTIIGDSPFDNQDSVKSVGEKPDCNSCGRTPQTVKTIQSCENGLTYNVGGDFPFIKFGDILNLTFKNNIVTNGCYTIVGTTLSTPLDTISTILGKYDICESCMKPSPTFVSPSPTPSPTPTPPQQLNTEIESCGNGKIYSVSGLIGNVGDVRFLFFEKGSVTDGCYTILGSTSDGANDFVIESSKNIVDCESCINPQP
jgi:hypothetical protein